MKSRKKKVASTSIRTRHCPCLKPRDRERRSGRRVSLPRGEKKKKKNWREPTEKEGEKGRGSSVDRLTADSRIIDINRDRIVTSNAEGEDDSPL